MLLSVSFFEVIGMFGLSEETLLQCTDLASCVRLLKPEHLNTGLELIRRIQERLVAILQHSTQVGLHPASHSLSLSDLQVSLLPLIGCFVAQSTASLEGFLSGLSKHRTFEWGISPKQDKTRNLLKLQICLITQTPTKRKEWERGLPPFIMVILLFLQ